MIMAPLSQQWPAALGVPSVLKARLIPLSLWVTQVISQWITKCICYFLGGWWWWGWDALPESLLVLLEPPETPERGLIACSLDTSLHTWEASTVLGLCLYSSYLAHYHLHNIHRTRIRLLEKEEAHAGHLARPRSPGAKIDLIWNSEFWRNPYRNEFWTYYRWMSSFK